MNEDNKLMVDSWNNLRQQYGADFAKADVFPDYQKSLSDFRLLHKSWLLYRSHQKVNDGFTRTDYALKNESDDKFDQSEVNQIFPFLQQSFDQLMQMDNGGLKFIHSTNKNVVYLLEKYNREIYAGFAAFTDEEILKKLLRNDKPKLIVVCAELVVFLVSRLINYS